MPITVEVKGEAVRVNSGAVVAEHADTRTSPCSSSTSRSRALASSATGATTRRTGRARSRSCADADSPFVFPVGPLTEVRFTVPGEGRWRVHATVERYRLVATVYEFRDDRPLDLSGAASATPGEP